MEKKELEIMNVEEISFDDLQEMEDVVNGATFGIGICCIAN